MMRNSRSMIKVGKLHDFLKNSTLAMFKENIQYFIRKVKLLLREKVRWVNSQNRKKPEEWTQGFTGPKFAFSVSIIEIIGFVFKVSN